MCLQRILQVLETAFFKCAWYILFPWPSSTKISISHVLWSTQWRFAKYLRGPGNCTLKMCLIFFIPSAVVNKNLNSFYTLYRGDDNSLDRPEGKQANASFSMAWISLGALPYKKKKNRDDSSRLDVVEIALVPGMLRSCFLPGRTKDLSATR